MPFLGLGIHIIIAIFFAIHAIRTGRQMYWLIILFSFPLLGSLVYFLTEYMPASQMKRGVRKVSSKAIQLLDPTRELREAKEAFDLSATVQNRIRLAAALDNAGEYEEAVAQFDACLAGPFANDPELCLGAAKAKLHVNQAQPALNLLLTLRQQQENFRAEQVSILLAKCYAALADNIKARDEFIYATTTFGSAESRAEYAIWAAKSGDLATATRLKEELDKNWKHWNKHSRAIHQPLFDALNEAINIKH
ncbi:MAG: hypothetical protein SFU55_03935 [Methylophilus sp.]|nr:hypothetical protein [Methylophilus sp.]